MDLKLESGNLGNCGHGKGPLRTPCLEMTYSEACSLRLLQAVTANLDLEVRGNLNVGISHVKPRSAITCLAKTAPLPGTYILAMHC